MAALPKSQFALHLRSLINSRSASTATAPSREVRPYADIPGPKGLPILGNAIQAFKSVPDVDPDPKNLLKIAPELFKQYGPILRLEAPGLRSVWLMCPELAEKALRAAGPVPRRPGFKPIGHVRETDEIYAGGAGGLLTSQGDEWQRFRRQVQQPMMRPKSAVGYTQKIEEVAQQFIDSRVRPRRDARTGETPEDFLYDLYRWALESVACIALNTRLGCFEPDLEEGSEQMQVIGAVRDIFESNAYLDQALLQWWKYLPSREMRRFRRATEVFQTVTTKYVGQAMKRIADAQSRDERGPPTLLELFAARGCSEKVATVMALDMIFAGVDTSSHSSAFFMYHLARNPLVQDRLRREVETALPSAEARLTDKSFERMPYMKAAFKEVLRMNPPAVANARVAMEDLELAGYHIPAGTEIATFHYVMGNSPVYVKDPEVFRPERFLKSSPLYENFHPFLLLPFGHGPRMCVGRRFAELEVFTLMSKILQNFKIEWHHGPVDIEVQTLTYPASPLRFKLIDN